MQRRRALQVLGALLREIDAGIEHDPVERNSRAGGDLERSREEIGDVLHDVDGRIGGYNFQWAWASGRLAGMHAARG